MFFQKVLIRLFSVGLFEKENGVVFFMSKLFWCWNTVAVKFIFVVSSKRDFRSFVQAITCHDTLLKDLWSAPAQADRLNGFIMSLPTLVGNMEQLCLR